MQTSVSSQWCCAGSLQRQQQLRHYCCRTSQTRLGQHRLTQQPRDGNRIIEHRKQRLLACHASMPRVATAAGATVAALALFVSSTPAAWGVQLERDLTPRYQVIFEQGLTLNPLGDHAGLFDSPNDTDPFTLYGTNFKKYEIEQMDGEKVISRQRGFTVDSCVSAIAADSETPEFNGLSTGEKVQAGNDLLCKRSTGPDLKKSCNQSCGDACNDALKAYEDRLYAETGLTLAPKERERVLRNCRHSCSYECTKSGKAHDFVVPSRR